MCVVVLLSCNQHNFYLCQNSAQYNYPHLNIYLFSFISIFGVTRSVITGCIRKTIGLNITGKHITAIADIRKTFKDVYFCFFENASDCGESSGENIIIYYYDSFISGEQSL